MDSIEDLLKLSDDNQPVRIIDSIRDTNYRIVGYYVQDSRDNIYKLSTQSIIDAIINYRIYVIEDYDSYHRLSDLKFPLIPSSDIVTVNRELVNILDCDLELSFKVVNNLEKYKDKAKIMGGISKTIDNHLIIIKNGTKITAIADLPIVLANEPIRNSTGLFVNTKFKSIDLNNTQLKNRTTVAMFMGCKAESISFEGCQEKKLINTSFMFDHCINLKSVNIGDMDTSEVYNFSNMFASCRAIEKLDLHNINTKVRTDMLCMFFECKELKQLDLSSLHIKITDIIESMLKQTYKLQELKLKNIEQEEYSFREVTMIPDDCVITYSDTE